MVKIMHVKGGIFLPKYNVHFPKGQAVEVDEKLAERLLRNPDFKKVEEKTERRNKK